MTSSPKPKRDRAAYMRVYRARRRAAPAVIPAFSSDPAAALADWTRKVLKVPAGHPRAGDPLTVPDYGAAFRRCGAASLVTRWKVRRAGVIVP